MNCPRCATEKTKVLKTLKGNVTERLRQCEICGYTWQTVEVAKTDKYLKSYARSLFDDESWYGDNALDEDDEQ